MNALIFISIWLVAISQCVAISQHVALKIVPTGAKVVFQWPMAFCEVNECRNDIGFPVNFTLHGVWPTYTPPPPHGTTVVCDFVSNPYSWSAIKELPNINWWISFKFRRHKKFLEHQWKKHGSCFEMNCAHYFESSLRLWQRKYTNILTALENNRIIPSVHKAEGVEHRIQSFYDAIVNNLNLRPMIFCKSDRNGWKYVVEIVLCATNDLNRFLNCPGSPQHHMRKCGGPDSRALFYRNPRRLDIKLIGSSQINTTATT